jgi:hypothetical protein
MRPANRQQPNNRSGDVFMSSKKRILSGMRPTGPLHLGNLHGALANWVDAGRIRLFFLHCRLARPDQRL